jgi:hypothetical protein
MTVPRVWVQCQCVSLNRSTAPIGPDRISPPLPGSNLQYEATAPYIARNLGEHGGACVLHHPGLNKFKVLHRQISNGADDYQIYKDW